MSKRKTNEEFLIELSIKNPNIIPLEPYGKGKDEKIKVTHKGFEKHIWEATPRNLLGNKPTGCPYCTGLKPLKGFNTFGDKFPDLIKYLKDKKKAYTIMPFVRNKVVVKCPECGYEEDKIISDLSRYGFSCKMCGDNISIPNKYNREILKQLHDKNIISEYDFECSFSWSGKYKYDSKFYFNNKMILEENQGMQHYVELNGKYKGKFNEIQKHDKEKKALANKQEIDLLVIDCSYSTKEFLKENFIKEYDKIGINLRDLDWDLIDCNAQKSLLVDICNYYEENKPIRVKDVAKVFKVGLSTASNYLNKGAKIGLCSYNNFKNHKIFSGQYNKEKVLVYKDNKLVHIFSSQAEAERQMKRIYCENFSQANINLCIKGFRKEHKGFIFRKFNDPIIEDFQKDENKIYKRNRRVVIYKDDVLIGEFKNQKEASKNIGVSVETLRKWLNKKSISREKYTAYYMD